MKRIKTGIFLIIFTMAAVLTGFALPGFTADYQEKHNLSQVDIYLSEDASFPTTYHVLDCIKLMAYGYEEVELESGKVHSGEEISEICGNLLAYFAENALLPEDSQLSSEEKTVFLAVKKEGGTGSGSDSSSGMDQRSSSQSEKEPKENSASYSTSPDSYTVDGASDYADFNEYDNTASEVDEDLDLDWSGLDNEPQTISAIIWECTILDQYGDEVTLWIDDLSGKMISFQCAYDPSAVLAMGNFLILGYDDLAEQGYDEKEMAEALGYSLEYLYSSVFTELTYQMDPESFFKDYYGFSEVVCDYYQIDKYLNHAFLVLTDKSGEQAGVDLSMSFDSLSLGFNAGQL